ncbi:MAG: HD domain-containing protein [Candidatus Absconditabacterales bacterium]
MKLHFEHLQKLRTHADYLQDHLGLTDFFVVGGVVRDMLLGKQLDIVDVDLTMCGDPSNIWTEIKQTKDISTEDKSFDLFRTEKFGTITILSRDAGYEIKYEITPFREESGYSDFRHPEHIIWSDSLLADASRRDFTINAMYYTNLPLGGKKIMKDSEYDEALLLKSLDTDGYALIGGVLVLQSHDSIRDISSSGSLDTAALDAFCQTHTIDQKRLGGILRDPYKGLQDIVDGKIRAVGDPDKRFNEDALRILRAVRFQNILNFDSILDAEFDYEQQTRKSMKKYYYLVKQLSKERIHEEIKKVFSGPNPFGYVAVLDELNLLKYIFPGIFALKFLNQPMRYHPFDVYSHSILALYHLQSINVNYLVRLAMLYHDCGKVEQYYTHTLGLDRDERSFIYGGWLNHVHCGQDIAKDDLERIGFSNKEIAEIQWYIGYHMKPGEILFAKPENWIKKTRELYADGGYERVHNLLDICKGDRRGHFNPIQKPAINEIDKLYNILDNLKESEGQFTMSKMPINGDDIMKEFDLKPGKTVGEYMRRAYEWVLEDVQERNKSDAVIAFLRRLS